MSRPVCDVISVKFYVDAACFNTSSEVLVCVKRDTVRDARPSCEPEWRDGPSNQSPGNDLSNKAVREVNANVFMQQGLREVQTIQPATYESFLDFMIT